jgi:single-strand DNA-binding protein
MYNKYIGIGYVVGDAELKYLGSGTPVTNFKVASNYKYGDSEEVLFMPCVLFGKIAEAISQYLTKGTLILVEGRLKEEAWEKDGQKRSQIKLIASNVKLLSGGKNNKTQAAPKEVSELEAF